jgi:hypothetical protein
MHTQLQPHSSGKRNSKSLQYDNARTTDTAAAAASSSSSNSSGGATAVRRRGSWKRQLNTALKASMTSGAFPSMRSQSLLACAGVLAVR